MKQIESFQIDHTRLKRGVFVSRKDHVGKEVVTTFDIRMKEPNNEPALAPEAAHTIEHIAATYLRSHPQVSGQVIYFGPMGCMTGFYLLLSGNQESMDVAPIIRELFRFVAEFEGEVPGATPIECGNHTFMDLATAKKEAGKYVDEVLCDLREENLTYPA